MRKSVVVVEDKAEDRNSILEALRELPGNSRVLAFSTAEEALEYLLPRIGTGPSDLAASTAVILLDFHLGAARAPHVLTTLRASHSMPFVPIIVFSDSQDPEDIRACYESGANGFVPKPVDFEEFQETVKTAARFWLQMNLCPA